MLEWMKTKWAERLFGSAITIIIFMLTQYFSAGRDAEALRRKEKEAIYAELANRPTFGYVDKQDESVKQFLNQYVEEADKRAKITDGKLDLILGYLISKKEK